MSTECVLVKVLEDQVTKPINLNKSKSCGKTHLVEHDNFIENKKVEDVGIKIINHQRWVIAFFLLSSTSAIIIFF